MVKTLTGNDVPQNSAVALMAGVGSKQCHLEFKERSSLGMEAYGTGSTTVFSSWCTLPRSRGIFRRLCFFLDSCKGVRCAALARVLGRRLLEALNHPWPLGVEENGPWHTTDVFACCLAPHSAVAAESVHVAFSCCRLWTKSVVEGPSVVQ